MINIYDRNSLYQYSYASDLEKWLRGNCNVHHRQRLHPELKLRVQGLKHWVDSQILGHFLIGIPKNWVKAFIPSKEIEDAGGLYSNKLPLVWVTFDSFSKMAQKYGIDILIEKDRISQVKSKKQKL